MGPGGNFAFAAANGAFPDTGSAGDFNQMQMMLAMQNGMQPGMFGGFPMMGSSSLPPYRLLPPQKQTLTLPKACPG